MHHLECTGLTADASLIAELERSLVTVMLLNLTPSTRGGSSRTREVVASFSACDRSAVAAVMAAR